MHKSEPFVRVNRAHPCPVCGRPDWCTVGESACICARVESGDRRGEAGWLHKLREDKPVTEPPPPKTPPRQPKVPSVDWPAEAAKYAAAMPAGHAEKLARNLGLPADALACFPLLGFDPGGTNGWYFTFPEVSGAGQVVGLLRRFRDGKKFQIEGGQRGLSVPHGFDPVRLQTVFIVEGASDVAAMTAAGLAAVGRHTSSGGWDMLTVLLGGCPDACRVVVVGENDAKADYDWPGLTGAAVVADRLAESLKRRPGSKRFPVAWSLCPDGVKDVRAWLTGRKEPSWAQRGEELAGKLLAQAVPAEGTERTMRRLAAEVTAMREQMAEVRELLKNLAR